MAGNSVINPFHRYLLGPLLATAFATTFLAGCGPKNDVVFTNAPKEQYDHAQQVLKVRERLAAAKKVEPWQIKPDEVASDPELKGLGTNKQEIEAAVSSAVAAPEAMQEPPQLKDFSEINWADAKSPVVNYASPYTPVDVMLKATPGSAPPKPTVATLGERLGKGEYRVFKVELVSTPAAAPGQPKAEPTTSTVFFGPIIRADLDKVIGEAMKRGQGQKITVVGDGFPVKFYANKEGKVLAGVDDPKSEVRLDRIGNAIQMTYYKYSADFMRKTMADSEKDPSSPMPPVQQIEVVRVSPRK